MELDRGYPQAVSTGARRVLGLTGQVVGPLGKREGLSIEAGEDFEVTPLT